MIRPDHAGLARLMEAEAADFRTRFPRSGEAAHARAVHWHRGVPFHWMKDWPSPWPLVAAEAKGARLTTVDGVTLDDFCLGDTAAMFGHAPPALVAAVRAQIGRGGATMLPSDQAAEVADRLAERYGLPYWQVTTTASEANRAILRWARAVTGRPRILIFNGCYHGAVDDVFVDLQGGRPTLRASLVGQVSNPAATTDVVEFNDLAALKAVLKRRQTACVLAEPVMTNVGMVRPQPGVLEAIRTITHETGTLLIWDETHTLSSGWAGHGTTSGVIPDAMVIGKAIGGGVPCAVYGFSAAMAAGMERARCALPAGHSGIGTTLSGNALALAAINAMLDQVMSQDAYDHMIRGAERLTRGLRAAITRADLPWHVVNVGARVEFVCSPHPLQNGTEARAAMAPEREAVFHLMLVNRGCLLAPFHNMALISPVTGDDAIDRLIGAFAECLTKLKDCL